MSFNADNSCFSVALESGFRGKSPHAHMVSQPLLTRAVFSSRNGEQKTVRDVGGGIGCAEMLGTTRYIALVGGGKQPKFPQNKVCPEDPDWVLINADSYEVQIWNDSSEVVATSLEFKTPVQRVRITQTHLVVVLLNKVCIYKMKMPPEKVGEYETVNNPFGLCCLSKDIVAFPGRTVGQVKVVHFNDAGNVSIINAHESPLRALALNQMSDVLATASEQGTIIRLWSPTSSSKLTEFRRGVDPATVFSLAFSPNGLTLAVTSDKSTLHLFDLPGHGATQASEPDPLTHKWGILSKVPLVPRQFSDKYSDAKIRFEIGDEPYTGVASKSATLNAGIPGM